MDRPVLVGWSYGATVAVHWADRNPGCAGVVAVNDYRAIADAVRELAPPWPPGRLSQIPELTGKATDEDRAEG